MRVLLWRSVLCCVGAAACMHAAQAQPTLPPAKPTFDPFSTVPPQLATGWPLPGDKAPVACGSAWDSRQALALEQAVDLALCGNPQVRAVWAAIKVQSAALGEAKAASLPTVNFSVGTVRDETRYPDSPFEKNLQKGETASASFAWRVWDFGSRAANQRAAQQLLEAALFSHDALLQKLLGNVVAAYFDVQTTRAAWLARQQTEALAQSTLDISKRRQNQGVGAPSDTLQAATALAKARLERSRARGEYDKAQAVLVNLTGLPQQSEVVVAEAEGEASGMGNTGVKAAVDAGAALGLEGANAEAAQRRVDELKGDLGQWLERAMDHPSVLAARAQLAAAQERVQSAQAEGAPTVDFNTSYYQNGRPTQGLSGSQTIQSIASLTLNVPVFEGFARTYKVRGAQALAEQRSAELQDSERQILLEVVRTHADAVASLDNLAASVDLQRWALEAAASVQRRYERGVSDILEMITAQAALADARQERIRALAEWQSARLRLLASSGALGRQAVGTR